MLQAVKAAIAALGSAPASIPPPLQTESIAFLEWLERDNFTFLGVREFELSGDPETGDLVPVEGSGLGVLRDPSVQVLRRGHELVAMTPEVRRFFFAPSPLIITKANVVSKVHRHAHMDYIGIKTYRADGTPKGEIRVVGLFTSQSYFASPTQVPFLRHKVDAVLGALGYPPSSHDGKAILNILESFPRDELFQIGVKQLREWVHGILDLETRPRVRVFARIDRFDRFVSLLVYVPRDRYTSTVRERIGALLSEVYDGRIVAFYPHFTDGPLVRVQFIVARYAGATPQVASNDLERGIAEIIRTWEDRLADAIAASGGDPEAAREARKQVSHGLLRRLCRDVRAGAGAGGHQAHRAAGAGPAGRRRLLQRAGEAGVHAGDLPLRPAHAAVRARADPGEPRLLRHRRAHLSASRRATATARAR